MSLSYLFISSNMVSNVVKTISQKTNTKVPVLNASISISQQIMRMSVSFTPNECTSSNNIQNHSNFIPDLHVCCNKCPAMQTSHFAQKLAQKSQLKRRGRGKGKKKKETHVFQKKRVRSQTHFLTHTQSLGALVSADAVLARFRQASQVFAHCQNSATQVNAD